MLKNLNLTIFLYFTLIVIMVNSVMVNYCDYQKYCKDNKVHIACKQINNQQDINNKTVQPQFTVILKDMTPKFKEIILEQINRVRSDVAMGKYNNTNIKQILPTASNMRLKRWNNDFEELAKMAVLKLNGKLGDYCFTTENYHDPPYPELTYSFVSNITTDDDDESIILKAITQNIEQSLDVQNKNWIKLLIANNTQIGCAHGIYTSGDYVGVILKCIENRRNATNVAQAYDIGDACSKCTNWDELCDTVKYPGLCVHERDIADVPESPIDSIIEPLGPLDWIP